MAGRAHAGLNLVLRQGRLDREVLQRLLGFRHLAGVEVGRQVLGRHDRHVRHHARSVIEAPLASASCLAMVMAWVSRPGSDVSTGQRMV